jgi:heme/copper-type cytochrome/quinol oxidase subunit 3
MLLVLNIVFYLHSPISRSLHSSDNMIFDTTWFVFTGVLFYWFNTVVSESGWGYHTIPVRQGLRFGMVLFIVSEIMFFFAFFWAFFHVSLAPSIAVGGIWPPKSIQALDVWGLPLVNTLLLLSSGLTITLAHRAILQYESYEFVSKFDKNLLATILLGAVFLGCQGIEYKYGIIFAEKKMFMVQLSL